MVGRSAVSKVMTSGTKRPTGHLFSNNYISGTDSSTDRSGANHQVQNVKKARVYVFGDADLAEDEMEDTVFEMSEVRARGKAKKQENQTLVEKDSEETYFERDIQKDDTIQSLSLKYGCRVSELKRINNLIRDQEFYALKSIKVPLRQYGVLTEILEQESLNGSKFTLGGNSRENIIIPVSEANEVDSDNDSETQELLVRTLSIRDAICNQGKEAANFLHKMDSDIKNIVASTCSRKDTLEEVTATLTCKSIRPLKKNVLDGADCGIQWKNIIVTLVLITLVVPLIYFLYFEYGKGQSTPNLTTNSTGS